MEEDKDGKINVNPEAPAYIKDFFDVPKVINEMTDLKFSKTPAFYSICDTFSFFGQKLYELAQNWDLDQTNIKLLNDPIFKKTFYEKLDFIFSEKVTKRTQGILKGAFFEAELMDKCFPPSCEHRLQCAPALAFIIHYGYPRKGEKDYNPKTGEELNIPLDYVRHPLKVAFFEMDDRRVGRLDEATTELGVYHDIFENFLDGIFSEKMLNIPPEKAEELLPYIKAYINLNQAFILNDTGASMSDLIVPISRKKEKGVLRPRHTLNLFLDLCSFLDDPLRFIRYLRDIVVKNADRLENEKTSKYLKEIDKNSFSMMMDETLYDYIPLADELGMVSTMDHLLDFFEIIDRKEWQAFFDADKERLNMLNTEEIFRNCIAEEIKNRLPDDNFALGKDYEIFLRPRALRYRKESISKGGKRKGQMDEKSEQQLKAMGRAFLNYVIFYPLVGDAAKREKLVGIARNVFDDMFKPSLSLAERYKLDKKTPLGSTFIFASDEGVKYPEDKKTPKFGTVAYKIFNSPHAMKKDLHGLIHALLIYGDKEAEAKIFKLFHEISGYVDNLKEQLDILDKALSVDSMITDTRDKISSLVGKHAPRADFSIYEVLSETDPAMLKNLIKLVERKILALFVKPIKINIRIIQEKGDRNIIRNFGTVEIPKGFNVAYALLHLAPHCLLYEIKECHIKTRRKSNIFRGPDALQHKLRPNTTIDIHISDIKPSLNEQSGNIEQAAENLDDFVLKNIRDKYLGKGKELSY